MFINVFLFINMMLLSLCPGDASTPLSPSPVIYSAMGILLFASIVVAKKIEKKYSWFSNIPSINIGRAHNNSD